MFTIKAMHKIALIVHNVRSTYNVGSILRSADGFGVNKVYLTGYTPYPTAKKDSRLPHLAAKTHRQIQKTALGAEKSISWHHIDDIYDLLDVLKSGGYQIVALEQTKKATLISKFKPKQDVALVVGSEVGGLPQTVLDICDRHVDIPMSGKKESFNVAVAAAIVLYHLKISS